MHREIFHGDVLDQIKKIHDESIDVMVTSPPYLWVRDYKEEKQWGLESSLEEYLDRLMLLMDEVHRVLKSTGTAWVNLGDTYSGGYAHSDWSNVDDDFQSESMKNRKFKGPKKIGFKPKSQIAIPQRFYARMVDAGWHARNWVTWVKNNAMPFSGTDRLKNMTEPVMFFAKSEKYFFDLDKIRVKPKTLDEKRKPPVDKSGQTVLFESVTPSVTPSVTDRKYLHVPGQEPNGIHRNRAKGLPDFAKQDTTVDPKTGKPKANYVNFNERWRNRKMVTVPGQTTQSITRATGGYDEDGEYVGNLNGANPGDVVYWDYTDEELLDLIKACRETEIWTPIDAFFINTKPTKINHYATFPIELPETILKCSCPHGGIVLDPFMGAGTTAIAAERLGLEWVGIELSAESIQVARKRLERYMNKKINQSQ